MGELTVALLVSGLTPLAGYYLQAGCLDWLPLLVVLPLCGPLCGLQFAMMLVINFPDAAGDAAVNKRTLTVRLGATRAARLCLWLLTLVYVSLPLLVYAGLPPLAALAMAAATCRRPAAAAGFPARLAHKTRRISPPFHLE